jgi:hypothetical protein
MNREEGIDIITDPVLEDIMFPYRFFASWYSECS